MSSHAMLEALTQKVAPAPLGDDRQERAMRWVRVRLLPRALLSSLTRNIARIERVVATPRQSPFGTPYLFDTLVLRLVPATPSPERSG